MIHIFLLQNKDIQAKSIVIFLNGFIRTVEPKLGKKFAQVRVALLLHK